MADNKNKTLSTPKPAEKLRISLAPDQRDTIANLALSPRVIDLGSKGNTSRRRQSIGADVADIASTISPRSMSSAGSSGSAGGGAVSPTATSPPFRRLTASQGLDGGPVFAASEMQVQLMKKVCCCAC
jgi:hypothetical protein